MEAAGEVRPHTARRGLQRERTMVGAVDAGLASGGSTATVPALVAFFYFLNRFLEAGDPFICPKFHFKGRIRYPPRTK